MLLLARYARFAAIIYNYLNYLKYQELKKNSNSSLYQLDVALAKW